MVARRLGGVLLIIAAVAILYWPSVLSYSVAWTDFENRGNTHGYLIVVMCFALLYLRRGEIVAQRFDASATGCLTLVVASLLWLLAYRASIQTLHQLLFPVVLWTAIYAGLGRGAARTCLFAVAFLYFAVPIWGYVAIPLQALTIIATRVILRTLGVPAQFDGIAVRIPDGTFVIEGGCSGVHFLVVALAIAAFYGALHRDSLRNRLLLVGVAAALALLSNWIRVSAIIIAGHVTHMQSYLVRVSHYGFGWSVFALATVGFFVFASRLPVADDEPARLPALAVSQVDSSHGIRRMALFIAALCFAPVLAWHADRADASAATPPLIAPQLSGWQGPLAEDGDWHPRFLGADQESLAHYQRGSAGVDWYVADYASQRQGKKLLGYDNSIRGAEGSLLLDESIDASGGHRFVSLRLQDSDGSEALQWYLYVTAGREMTSGLRAQLWYGVSSLTRPVDSRIISLRTKCDPDCAAARERLRLFVGGICDNTSRFDNCRRDRAQASDKLKKTPTAKRDEPR